MNNTKPNQETWKTLLPKCFGISDFVFGGHPSEEDWMKKMFKAAKKEGASKRDIVAEAKKFLEGKEATTEHIDEQLKRISKKIPISFPV